MLYAQWRFRGLDPHEAYNGPGAPPSAFPGRVEAVLAGFAIEAAERESAALDLLDSFAGKGGS